jgi:hypothetical protein
MSGDVKVTRRQVVGAAGLKVARSVKAGTARLRIVVTDSAGNKS